MTSPISGANGVSNPYETGTAQPPAKLADPDHDGDVDGAAGDKPANPLSTGRGIDTRA